jgi:8-hydroxy-5-deazaflavin:NADPH oxidoreductase
LRQSRSSRGKNDETAQDPRGQAHPGPTIMPGQEKRMNLETIAIFGTGEMGSALARRLVQAGRSVRLVNRGGTGSIRPLLAELGGGARLVPAPEAVAEAGAVILALPWRARRAAFAAAGGPTAFVGQIVVDAMNPCERSLSSAPFIQRRSSLRVDEDLGRGARLVKALNTLGASQLWPCVLSQEGATRLAVPVCGDYPRAKEEVLLLLSDMGLDGLDIGPLGASLPMEPGQALFGTIATLADLAARSGRSQTTGTTAAESSVSVVSAHTAVRAPRRLIRRQAA